jgi:hypothetical protein
MKITQWYEDVIHEVADYLRRNQKVSVDKSKQKNVDKLAKRTAKRYLLNKKKKKPKTIKKAYSAKKLKKAA